MLFCLLYLHHPLQHCCRCPSPLPAPLAPPSAVPQVIDLISLKPFDMETISKSIKKTRKVGAVLCG